MLMKGKNRPGHSHEKEFCPDLKVRAGEAPIADSRRSHDRTRR